MLNIEKHKSEIVGELKDASKRYSDIDMQLGTALRYVYDWQSDDNICDYESEDIINWFLSEYKEPILTDEEREWLSNVIKPFRKTVVCIERRHTYYMGVEKQYIRIHFVQANDEKTDWYIDLPWFEPNTMYTGMKLEYPYNLEELGL